MLRKSRMLNKTIYIIYSLSRNIKFSIKTSSFIKHSINFFHSIGTEGVFFFIRFCCIASFQFHTLCQYCYQLQFLTIIHVLYHIHIVTHGMRLSLSNCHCHKSLL